MVHANEGKINTGESKWDAKTLRIGKGLSGPFSSFGFLSCVSPSLASREELMTIDLKE